MDCASCVRKIEGHLANVDGILSVEGSPMARTLTVHLDPERRSGGDVREAVGRLGYTALELKADEPSQVRAGTWQGRMARITYASVALFAVGMLLRGLGATPVVVSLPLHDLTLPDLFFLASALVGGWNFFGKGVRAARALALDMNFLMTVAIAGAIGIGDYLEASAIAFLFALAELLEHYSVDRARASVQSLLKLSPEVARVLRDGRELAVPTESLVAGDEVVVRPGERIPADGLVSEGASAVDQSPITGESLPVDKAVGDEVLSGTINREGYLRIRLTRRAKESALARIVRLVEDAEANKSRTERFVERFARYYTPAVTLGAILVVVVPTLAFGAPFVPWFIRGLTLLVIACPCALVISTPVAVVSAVTAAARHGVLIKGGVHLEAMGGIQAIALDKTGTLTYGHLRVVEVQALGGVTEVDALARAAAVESRSEHPVAKAIVEAGAARGVASPWTVTDFTSEPGRGVRARLDGVEHAVGKPSHVGSDGKMGGAAPAAAGAGHTRVGLTRQGEVIAWILLADRPREGAAEAVRRLREAGVHRLVMLTGDNQATASLVGREVGVDEVLAELLPEDKVEAITDLAARYGSVAMVGDGVNDAPALASATVGIAMGAAGSDTALETADIALMGDDLGRLPYLYTLSRRARSVIRQNIALSLVVKGGLALAVPFGLVPLVAAVLLGDMGVSVAVILNALRLGRVRA
jgi:Cd2+/Zn2+-exporting ATPase